ncbi:DedA family protein [Paenibacillus sp. NPDC058071]|uniref:DedA family protein n=1 Tax=Paenibacillus sp. NPDC058071 TaxID=3346326 RepID=UPI0036DE8D26
MGYQYLLDIIEQLGYIALFLVLCLGLIGLPIPNEAVVMTGGALASSGMLEPIPAYLMTFLGICSAMSFNYSIGRFAGSRLFEWFMRKKNMSKYLEKAQQLSDKYGGLSLGIGLLLPFLRHVMPFVAGTNRFKYTRFAVYAYPSAFIWTLIYFALGAFFGINVESISDLIYDYGMIVVYAVAVVGGYACWRWLLKPRIGKSDKLKRKM